MENIGLIKKEAASAYALDLGCGAGADAEYLNSIGYRVTAVDEEMHFSKAVVSDIRTFPIESNKYSLIICNNVLSFIGNKASVESILIRIIDGLKAGGASFLTFYGPHSGFNGREDMSFYEYNEVLAMVERLSVEIMDRTTTEGYTKNGKGEIIYQHSHRFILKKK